MDQNQPGPRVHDAPAADRPRERLLSLGAAALRTAELLAILIRSGRTGESALQAGEKIAAHFKDQLDRGELHEISSAVAKTAYCQIMAGIELGRRVAQTAQSRGDGQQKASRILGSEEALLFCRERFDRLASDATQEEFHIVCLDTKNRVTGTHRISVGCLDRSLVHPREVFRPAIQDAAKSILLVHNHPSGDPTPSADDLSLTERLQDAGKTLGIAIVDHIVVARSGAVSIREQQDQ
jgi:DNA repair protein RadC